MIQQAPDQYQDIRDGVRALCANFPDEYHRKVDQAKGYPEDFVDALVREGWMAALIPEAYGGAPTRQQVDGRHRLGQDRGVAVTNGVHQATDLDPGGVERQGGVHGDGLQAFAVGRLTGCSVEVVPHRDPVEAHVLDTPPGGAQVRGMAVLKANVDTELGHRLTSVDSQVRPTATTEPVPGDLVAGDGGMGVHHLIKATVGGLGDRPGTVDAFVVVLDVGRSLHH